MNYQLTANHIQLSWQSIVGKLFSLETHLIYLIVRTVESSLKKDVIT